MSSFIIRPIIPKDRPAIPALPAACAARILHVAAAFLILVPPGLAVAQKPCPVILIAEGVRGTQGSVGFVVFSSEAGWPDKYEMAFERKATPAKPGDVSVTVELPPGRYAISMLHDENGNKKLDRKPSGRPREGYGISNNPKVILKAPSFKAAAVQVTCGARVPIRVRYPSSDKNKEEARLRYPSATGMSKSEAQD